jgi:hypothetical protein
MRLGQIDRGIFGTSVAFSPGVFNMFGTFFDTTEVDRFADWVVGEFKRELPPKRNPPPKNISDRTNKLDQALSNKTREFVGSTKLNVYKKARLASRVREGMAELGYPESFVKSVTYDLISRMQVPKK